MIGGCFLSTGYAFLADVYTEKRISTRNGQLEKKWQFWKTIACWVGPFTSTSFKAQGTNEDYGSEYDKQSYLKMLTKEPLSRTVQVYNIRDKTTGNVIYAEFESRGNPPTWYNANGSSPILDPFGTVIEWDTTIHRAEQQGEISV